MKMTAVQLKEILVKPGHIKPGVFDNIVKKAEVSNKEIDKLLIEEGLIKEDQLGQLLAGVYGLPYINLVQETIDETVLKKLPALVAKAKMAIPFKIKEGIVSIGMVNPIDMETRQMLEKKFSGKVKIFLITKKDFNAAIVYYKENLKDEINSILNQLKDSSIIQNQRNSLTVKLVDTILEYANDSKASDIHIEPYASRVVVRYRIDGIMHTVIEMPKLLLDFLITRIKILARMRIDEHRAAQDGKFQFKTKDETVDMRVSIVPVTEGENAVLRLLSASARGMSLNSLGFSGPDYNKVKKAIKNPHGLMLVTGPTGSGKTTTIYEILKILNKSEIHIASIEDPVEYDMEGVSQIQVNAKTNLTFAKGLRAIVRQDPDIIMIGEIRDKETAEIAINSAMTGHFVLSTLHANDAPTTLPRLLEMDIEPFLIATTVNIIISQRLTRKLCEKCRASYQLSEKEIVLIQNNPLLYAAFMAKGKEDLNKVFLFKSAGCKVCADTGYSGRLGLFEVMVMNDAIKELVVNRASSDEILEAAKKDGMTNMLEDGIEKALNGETTLMEVLRVTES
ncbi:type II/IV secretion system protein [bacterium]|nr:type II/IV secretion system protein [bacterium]